MRLLCRRLGRASAAVTVLCVGLYVAAPPAVVNAAPPGSSFYVPISPSRILDTRGPSGFPSARRVNAGEAFTLALPGVPAGSSAVVLNLTVTNPADGGFVTVYPTGVARPTVSSINVDVVGETIANLVTVPIGVGGTVDIYSQLQTDLVADVQGYYVPAGASQAGRFVPMTPARLLDTREPSSPHVGALGPGEAINVDVAGLAGLPADTVAAALKITITESRASGYWTVFPADTIRPTASNLNVDGAGVTIANQVLARLTGGRMTVYAQLGGHLVIDLVGYFSGPSAPSSDVGLFVPVTPARLLDSREAPLGATPGHNRTAEVAVANRFGVPPNGVEAVVVNATITAASGPGYFSLWPARTYRPNASSLNASRTGQTIADQVITPVSTAGFAFYTQTGAHLVADIAGWYTGTELPTILPPHVPLTGVGGPPANASYAFSPVGPVRWNPCAAVRYVVNLGGYDAGNRQVINEAVERLEAATGLPLVPAGDSTFMPTSAHPTSTAPSDGEIVIALGDQVQTDLVPTSTVGRTNVLYLNKMFKASVVIDMGDIGARPAWSGGGAGPVLLHELAHAVGLGHVNDPAQLMNPSTSSSGPTTYSGGDLAGLWQLGASAGCLP